MELHDKVNDLQELLKLRKIVTRESYNIVYALAKGDKLYNVSKLFPGHETSLFIDEDKLIESLDEEIQCLKDVLVEQGYEILPGPFEYEIKPPHK